jgi:hypothetical protein
MSECDDTNNAEWIESRRQCVLQLAEPPANWTVTLLWTVHEVWKWIFALPDLNRRVAGADFPFPPGLFATVANCLRAPKDSIGQQNRIGRKI